MHTANDVHVFKYIIEEHVAPRGEATKHIDAMATGDFVKQGFALRIWERHNFAEALHVIGVHQLGVRIAQTEGVPGNVEDSLAGALLSSL